MSLSANHVDTIRYDDIHGSVAEFETVHDLKRAANAARHEGYTEMDAYSPFPIHGMTEAMGWSNNIVPWIVAFAGFSGTVGGLALEYYTAVIDYPLNVGGKPIFTLPMFFVPMFEFTILFASFGAFFGMWALNGLPRYHHPIFSAKNFERASVDRFFLCIEAKDPQFDSAKTMEFLKTLSPIHVSLVEEPEE